MGDFFAARPMEDFFINPTIVDDHRYILPPTTMNGTTQYRNALRDYHYERRSSSTSSTALKQHAYPSKLSLAGRNTSYHYGYTSEEEQPSPVDNDSSSFQSREALSVGSDFSLPDDYAGNCSPMELQCSQARAIKIQPVGRARMVSLPKLVTTSSRRSSVQQAESSNAARRRSSVQRPESMRDAYSVRYSEESSTSSNSFTSVPSPTSTAPSSVDDFNDSAPPLRHKKTISRHVPLMEAARAMNPSSPSFPPSASSIRRTSIGATESMSARSSTEFPSRKSSKFGLNRAFNLAKNSMRKDDSSDLESIKEPEAPTVAPLSTTYVEAPHRRVSRKLVARGAGDRAPPISLPPFPA